MMHVQNPAGSKPLLFRFGTAILALVMVLAGQLVSYVFAQENLSPDDGVFTQRVSGVGRLDDFGSYLRLQHYAGDGVGYTDSYTSLGLMQPLYQDGSLWFADTEFLLANDANVGANLGLGYRFYSPTWDRIFGASLWYDFDGRHVNGFQQMGISLETLGELWDFRTNVYIPTGRTVRWLGGADDITWTSRFEQNRILLLGSRPAEVGMTGLDMELGSPLPGWLGQQGVRGYGGWYHFQAEDIPQAWGAMGRLEGQLTQNTSVQLTLTNDRVFDTNLVFGISWVFPGGSGRRGGEPVNTYDRLLQPVQRRANVVVATDEDRDAGTVVARDATSGRPIEVQHVDASASAGGSGAFELPFRTLAEVQAGSDPGQVIYVHSGTYAGGITLQAGQHLLGDGMVHSLLTRQGTIDLPVLHPGEFPLLVDGLQPGYTTGRYAVVVAAANTEVSGFEIHPLDSLPAGSLLGMTPTGYPAAFVEGTATGYVGGILAQGFTGDVSISNNTIEDGNDYGIRAYAITGNVNIQGNTSDDNGSGVGIESITGNLTVNENTITNSSGLGIYIWRVSGRTEVSRNAIAYASNGISLRDGTAPDSIAILDDNVVTHITTYGISVSGFPTAYARNNYVSGAYRGLSVTDCQRADIAGNEIRHMTYYGLYADNNLDTTIYDNHVVNCREGIFVGGPSGDPIPYAGGTLAIYHNQIERVTSIGSGISLVGIEALTTIDANTISLPNLGGTGIYITNQTGDLTLTNNDIRYSTTNPSFQAVHILQCTEDQHDTIFTLRGNTVEGAGCFDIVSDHRGSGWMGVNLIENSTDGYLYFRREGTGSEGATLEYYLQDNTGTVENPGGRATQVFSPITH